MEVFFDQDSGQFYASPEDFAQDNAIGEGEEFQLVKMDVVCAYTYKKTDGKVGAVAVAFPEELVI